METWGFQGMNQKWLALLASVQPPWTSLVVSSLSTNQSWPFLISIWDQTSLGHPGQGLHPRAPSSDCRSPFFLAMQLFFPLLPTFCFRTQGSQPTQFDWLKQQQQPGASIWLLCNYLCFPVGSFWLPWWQQGEQICHIELCLSSLKEATGTTMSFRSVLEVNSSAWSCKFKAKATYFHSFLHQNLIKCILSFISASLSNSRWNSMW